RLHRPLAREQRAPTPDDLGEAVELLPARGIPQESRDRGEAGRGARVEEGRADLVVLVSSCRFVQKPDDGEEIAKNADAPLGGPAAPRQRRRVPRPLSEGAEQIQLDGRAQRRRPPKGKQRLKDRLR